MNSADEVFKGIRPRAVPCTHSMILRLIAAFWKDYAAVCAEAAPLDQSKRI